ncbi:prephenate dehydratase [Frankia casuarinae]|uniref:Prephenate dehydratase n=1 Tax=Frankia casuarinae (strain DSM 45818 / CECT 9043 / HFP020203 / CcI3) TaxID=106370 RepID=Q2JA40_FRACC|nr:MULTISPECIES: prephenate dehydratase [Frankia]ABD11852.1 prephenate dehydratase [Frankia casuarinae]ETA00731.1 prephenate dehydratase [Frankia sp. CcI6]EYT90645.1 prephenate dehydratase [Frankia casuarinae]KDA41741.1 prephenate dehydratase [Frankia sp. BMG5.23]KEZ35152.1 prephenate dehydratase [Frankia sp. CeD]
MPAYPPRYTYLGPEGTFTEAALRTLPDARTHELFPSLSVAEALDAVRNGDASGALVPIENSVEGAVTATLDELATGRPLMICREVLLPISFALLVRPGTTLEDVKTVTGHPVARAQVRRWLAAHLPYAEWESAASNAEGARLVREGRFDCAFAGEFTARRYRLEALVTDIHDVPDATTRFVLLGRPGRATAPTNTDKTSIVVWPAADEPGALLELLQEWAVRGANLMRIESRPTGEGLGRYCFSIDAEGHISDRRVREALMGLHRICRKIRFLGSYPRADEAAPSVPPSMTDHEFVRAADWLARCLDGRGEDWEACGSGRRACLGGVRTGRRADAIRRPLFGAPDEAVP